MIREEAKNQDVDLRNWNESSKIWE